MENLPDYLQPAQSDILRSNKNYQFLLRNSSIKADSGISPARSMQVSMHCGDEFAEQEFSDLKLASLREAVKGPNILFSTPSGRQGQFFNIWLNGHDKPLETSFNFLTVHWKEKIPKDKWDEFYNSKIKEYNGSESMLRRNLELSWDSLDNNNKVFSSFTESRDVVDIPKFALGITIAGWDFGFGAPTVCVLITIRGDEMLVLDVIYASGLSPHEFSTKVMDACVVLGLGVGTITHIGDSSGASKPREGTGESSFDLFRKAGIIIQGGTHRILEGIQTINGEFYKGKLKINKKLQIVIDALNMAKFPVKEGGDIRREEYECPHPYIDILDAMRYAIVYIVGRLSMMFEPDTVPGGWK